MSNTLQISFNKSRDVQMARILLKCPELVELGTADAVYKILFDAMDNIVPYEEIEIKSKKKQKTTRVSG